MGEGDGCPTDEDPTDGSGEGAGAGYAKRYGVVEIDAFLSFSSRSLNLNLIVLPTYLPCCGSNLTP